MKATFQGGDAVFYQPSDEELMSQVKMRKVDSFEALFARYRKPLFNFIFRMIGDFHKAQDIFQETFLRVFHHAQRYDESLNFPPWLYQIARNLCLEEIRRQKRNEIISLDEGVERQPLKLSDRGTPDEELEAAETEQIVAEALLRLSEEQREVFLLRENHGLSYEEMSRITGLSVSAVKSCLHRARMALRNILGSYLRSGKYVRGKLEDEMR
jgi:RNA polymerase sigma-70 factor (ECF subfamily)